MSDKYKPIKECGGNGHCDHCKTRETCDPLIQTKQRRDLREMQRQYDIDDVVD